MSESRAKQRGDPSILNLTMQCSIEQSDSARLNFLNWPVPAIGPDLGRPSGSASGSVVASLFCVVSSLVAVAVVVVSGATSVAAVSFESVPQALRARTSARRFILFFLFRDVLTEQHFDIYRQLES